MNLSLYVYRNKRKRVDLTGSIHDGWCLQILYILLMCPLLLWISKCWLGIFPFVDSSGVLLKGFSKNRTNFTGKYLCRSLFVIKSFGGIFTCRTSFFKICTYQHLGLVWWSKKSCKFTAVIHGSISYYQYFLTCT